MKKWLVRGLGTAVAVIIVTTGILAWVVASESGTRWLLQSVVPAIEDRVEITGVSGNLLSPLAIERIRFSDCQLETRISKADLRWDPAQLLDNMAYVSFFTANRIEVDILDNCDKQELETATTLSILDSIDLPIDFDIRRAALGSIVIGQANTTHTVEDVRFRAGAQGRQAAGGTAEHGLQSGLQYI